MVREMLFSTLAGILGDKGYWIQNVWWKPENGWNLGKKKIIFNENPFLLRQEPLVSKKSMW